MLPTNREATTMEKLNEPKRIKIPHLSIEVYTLPFRATAGVHTFWEKETVDQIVRVTGALYRIYDPEFRNSEIYVRKPTKPLPKSDELTQKYLLQEKGFQLGLYGLELEQHFIDKLLEGTTAEIPTVPGRYSEKYAIFFEPGSYGNIKNVINNLGVSEINNVSSQDTEEDFGAAR